MFQELGLTTTNVIFEFNYMYLFGNNRVADIKKISILAGTLNVIARNKNVNIGTIVVVNI